MGTATEIIAIKGSYRSPTYQKLQSFLPCSCLIDGGGGEYVADKTIITNGAFTIN